MDLAPEGFIHLPECYERYCLWLWKDHRPREELEVERRLSSLPGERALSHRTGLAAVADATTSEMTQLFVSGDLQALVRTPGQTQNLVIPQNSWRDAFFPERLFLAEEVRPGHGDHFDAAVGRTPFVSVEALEHCLFWQDRRRADLSSRGALRDALIGLTMDGVLSSKEAEQFGERWGLSPFSIHPDTALFDPMQVPHWTLAMAVAWIAWRDVSQVRNAWRDYRQECWEWFGFRRRLPLRGGEEWYEIDGEELRPLQAASVAYLGMVEALRLPRDEPQVFSVKSARLELWRAFSSGEIAATGLDRQRNITEVRANEWPYLELASDDNLSDYLWQRSRGFEPSYTDLTVPSASVLKVWPPERPTSSAVAELVFDLAAPFWTLWEAALWVGSEGRQLSSAEIAGRDLDDIGAAILFRKLASESDLTATGFNRMRVREPVPHGYWELATVNPALFRDRHYVSFIDDILDEYGGQLTPFNESSPRWFGIQIKREDLFEAFPSFAPFVPKPTTNLRPTAHPGRSARKVIAARQAILQLYPNGFPPGLSDKERLDAVNRQLKLEGQSQISLSTMNRATKS